MTGEGGATHTVYDIPQADIKCHSGSIEGSHSSTNPISISSYRFPVVKNLGDNDWGGGVNIRGSDYICNHCRFCN